MSHHATAPRIDVDLLEEAGDRFVFESQIGEGTYATVWKAKDTAVIVSSIIPNTYLACSSAFRKMKPRRFFTVFADFLPHFQGGFSNTARAVFLPLFYEVHFCGKMSGFCRIIKCGKKPLRFFLAESR